MSEVRIFGHFSSFDNNNIPYRSNRFQLSGLEDSKFHFAAFPLTSENSFPLNLFRKLTHVKIQAICENDIKMPILANLNSLSNALKISKKKLIKAAASHHLESLIQKRQELLIKFVRLRDKYINGNEKSLNTLNLTSTGLTQEALEDVFLTTLKIAILKNETKLLTIAQHFYLVTMNLKGKVHLLSTRTAKKIGQGNYGYVCKIQNLTSGKWEAVKLANHVHPEKKYPEGSSEYRNKSKQSVKNEFDILMKLHENNPPKSIQDKPRCFINFENETDQFFGFLGHWYPLGTALDAISKNGILTKMSAQQRTKTVLEGCCQLVEGLNFLHSQNLVHGDLNLVNIFLAFSKEGRLVFKIGDFGGSCFLPDNPRSYTAEFFPTFDHEKITLAEKNGNLRQKTILQKKRDIFALGSILYILMTEVFPYQIDDESDRPIIDKDFFNDQYLLDLGYRKEICAIINQMLSYEPEARPDCSVFKQQLDDIVTSLYPHILFQAYINDCNHKKAKELLTAKDQNCFLIRDSQSWNSRFVISFIKKKGLNKMFHEELIQIDSENSQITRFSKKGGNKGNISFQDIQTHYGFPCTTL